VLKADRATVVLVDEHAPPLLLGPEDREGPALRARRARAIVAIAKARIPNAWLRYSGSVLAALIAWSVFHAEIALYWVAGLALVVFIDQRAHAHQLKRCEAGDPPMRMPRMLAWTFFQSAYGNALAAVLWFIPLASAQSLAVMFLCAGIVNAAATLRHSASLSLAALTPAIAYMVGLPLAEFLSNSGRESMHLVPLIGALLLLAWGVRLWNSLIESDRVLAAAESAAMRERQAAAAAAAAKTDSYRRVTNELRAPLAALNGAVEHLRRAASTPSARAHVASLVHAKEVLGRVADDLASPEKLENGALSVAPKATNPADAARDAVAAFRIAAHDKGIELLLDLDPEVPPLVEIDTVRVRQVLFNLLDNAVRHTRHGGVRVRVASDMQADGQVKLAFHVIDTGPGISREHAAAAMSATRFGAGDNAGIGLAIAARLAKRMGGALTAHGELGQGSHFVMTLRAPVFARSGAATRGAA
jgi:signal transduction histidine kinase